MMASTRSGPSVQTRRDGEVGGVHAPAEADGDLRPGVEPGGEVGFSSARGSGSEGTVVSISMIGRKLADGTLTSQGIDRPRGARQGLGTLDSSTPFS